jgi:hypothetical protein
MKSSSFPIKFPTGQVAQAIEICKLSSPQDVASYIQTIESVRGVMPVSGGAYDYPTDVIEPTSRLIRELLHLAFEHNIMLIDGGTNTGVMKIIGENYLFCKNKMQQFSPPPVIGFSPKNKVYIPGITTNMDGLAPLDNNHPYFVLINDAQDWGEEVNSMFALVDHISSRVPSLALVANGGLTTLIEVCHSVEKKRQIVVLEGTKRAAMLIVSTLRGDSQSELERILTDPEVNLIKANDPDREKKIERVLSQLEIIRKYDKIAVFDLANPTSEFRHKVLQYLSLQ